MSMSVIAVLAAASAIGPTPVTPHHIGAHSARDALLATPAPYPANRVESPDRPQNGRLWHSRWPIGTRTPIREQVYADPGAASYGAPKAAQHDVIYVRKGHQVIAINPWTRHADTNLVGFEDFERARNLWLREQGYVLTVRTHVNPRYHRNPYEAMKDRELPRPRATIRVHPQEEAEPESPVARKGPGTVLPAVATHEIRARLEAERKALAEADQGESPDA